MKKILDMMTTKEYANKLCLKLIFFSNLVHMILSVYDLDEDVFSSYIDSDDNTLIRKQCEKIDTDDINDSFVKVFPMMIRIDNDWVESSDILISRCDRFVWWWIDYLCYSLDDTDDHVHILEAISTYKMFKKTGPLLLSDVNRLFFPNIVTKEV